MKSFKRGDWVITPYNKYPYKLEQGSQQGFFDTLMSGIRFFRCQQKDALVIGKTLVHAIRDGRASYLSSEGWYPVERVRLATKKDFKPLIDFEKQNIKRANKNLKMYAKIEVRS